VADSPADIAFRYAWAYGLSHDTATTWTPACSKLSMLSRRLHNSPWQTFVNVKG
jgi:hypothetical protein